MHQPSGLQTQTDTIAQSETQKTFDPFAWAYPIKPDEVLAAINSPEFPATKETYKGWPDFIARVREKLATANFIIDVQNTQLKPRSCRVMTSDADAIAQELLGVHPNVPEYAALMRELSRTVGVRARLGSFSDLASVQTYLEEHRYKLNPIIMKRDRKVRVQHFAHLIQNILDNFPAVKGGRDSGSEVIRSFLEKMFGQPVELLTGEAARKDNVATLKAESARKKKAARERIENNPGKAKKPAKNAKPLRDKLVNENNPPLLEDDEDDESLEGPVRVTFPVGTPTYDYDGREVVLLTEGDAFEQLRRATRGQGASATAKNFATAIGFILRGGTGGASIIPIFRIADKRDPKDKKPAAVVTGRALTQERVFAFDIRG